MDWDRLSTLMIRFMIRQFLAHPGEFLTFRKLSFLIPGSDSDVLHAIAEQRSDLFAITKDDRSLKLFPDAVQRIIRYGVERAVVEIGPSHSNTSSKQRRGRCGHFSEEDILEDLLRCSIPPEALTRNCCWTEICRVRGLNQNLVDQESWREVCRIRGYLQERQNPRGF